MKKLILLLTLLSLVSAAKAQRTGGMVVPYHWEAEDSLRFGIFVAGAGFPGWSDSLDRFGANFDYEWGGANGEWVPGGKRKGWVAYGNWNGAKTDLTHLGEILRPQTFYPTVDSIGDITMVMHNWRYVDTTGYFFRDNRYDANDISAYAEWCKSSNIVKDHFPSKRYASFVGADTNSQQLLFGKEGRVILGYSDLRLAKRLFYMANGYSYRPYLTTAWRWKDTVWINGVLTTLYLATVPPRGDMTFVQWTSIALARRPTSWTTIEAGSQTDTISRFTSKLEFAIDTSTILLDSTNLSADNAPLLRVQVLFKKGVNPNTFSPGWPVLPFVPFRTKNNLTKPGWLALIDTVITKANYRTLPDDWRSEDVLENGSASHSWKFKQLRIPIDSLLADLPELMKAVEDNPYSKTGPFRDSYWDRSLLGRISGYLNQDSLVRIDSSSLEYTGDSTTPIRDVPLVEIRILSTYRATVQVRNFALQDSIGETFLHRQRFSVDSTHTYSKMDDSLSATVADLASRVPTGVQREILFNDTEDPFSAHSIPGMALIDHWLAKYGFAGHPREQEARGNWSLLWRRECMSFTGKPPSLFENQTGPYYSNRASHENIVWNYNTNAPYNQPIVDIFPGDYIPYDSLAIGTLWPSSARDTMQGLILGRPGSSSDYYAAWLKYDSLQKPQSYARGIRATAETCLNHPPSKRMSFEVSPLIWGEVKTGAIRDSAYHYRFPNDVLMDGNGHIKYYTHSFSHYKQRITTPEEISASIFTALSEGSGAMNHAQFLDAGGSGDHNEGAPGAFGLKSRYQSTDPSIPDNSYNFGWRRTQWCPSCSWLSPDSNTIDNLIPRYYLGYSNTYRAMRRVLSRVQAVYDTGGGNAYPLKRFTWLGAYDGKLLSDTAYRYTSQGLMAEYDSYVKHGFLTVSKTLPVNPWLRNAAGSYIDSAVSKADPLDQTFVQIGLFKDSVSTTQKGYGAMVVNLRTWPSLREPTDSLYFNTGLAPLDRSHSLYGDIDVRKVFLKIDKTKMDSAMRSNYYVVRDIEHPDTNWLVKSDSTFAIYLKPGDAKFLYFEPGIAIDAAKNSISTAGTFGFNNARRVAEREGGKRMVVTYTRNDSLFVSYPAVGTTWEGYNERSAGDNVATGYEELVDAGPCKWPCVSVGQNDSAVAISYWKRDSTGDRVHFAYQPNYGLAWSKAYNEYLLIPDSNVGPLTSGVTPLSDTSWIVVVNKIAGTKPGLFAARFGITNKTPHFSNSYQLKTAFVPDTILYPTVSSRPLADSLWPVRIAWENRGEIYRMALSWSSAQPVMSAIIGVSGWLTDCDHENHHPSIALAGHIQVHPNRTADTVMHEDIVWESKQTDTTGTHYWIASRYFVQPYKRVAGQWSIFTLFRPDTLSPLFHFPNVSSSPKKEDFVSFGLERLRIQWHNTGKVEGAHWTWPFGGWRKTVLKEDGFYPSGGQSTDSLEHWSTSTSVPQSLVWVRPEGINTDRVRITNGKYSLVSYTSLPFSQYQFVFYRYLDREQINCNPPPPPQLLIEPRGKLNPQSQTPRELHWKYSVPGSDNTLPERWSVSEGGANQLLVVSDTFSVLALDSIYVPRTMDTVALDSVQGSLVAGDKLELRILLLRMRDSLQLATIDSIVFTSTSALYPGHGLPAAYAGIKLPGSFSADTAFLAVTMEKIDRDSIWGRSIIETFPEEIPVAEKRNRPAKVQASSALEISVMPNPFNPTAEVNIAGLTPDSPAKVELFDVLGRPIMTLFDGMAHAAELRLTLDGSSLNSGSYMLRVQTPTAIRSSKVQLIK